MRRFILNAIIFFLLATVLYLVVFAALCVVKLGGTPVVYRTSDVLAWKGGSTWQKFREFNPDRSYDVVFLGSSHAYRGYDPAIFAEHGYTAFNLGTSAQTPLNSYYIVKHYLNGNNTNLLLLDVYEMVFENDGLEATSLLVQNLDIDAAAVGMSLALKDPRAMNMLALRTMRSTAEPMYYSENYAGAGFSAHFDSLRSPFDYPMGRPFEPRSVQVKYFTSLLQLCKERGIPIVLVNHPFPKESDSDRHKRFNMWLERQLEGFDVPYLDMAYEHDLHSMHHFADHNHLNAAGVARFNPELIESLEEQGLLAP